MMQIEKTGFQKNLGLWGHLSPSSLDMCDPGCVTPKKTYNAPANFMGVLEINEPQYKQNFWTVQYISANS